MNHREPENSWHYGELEAKLATADASDIALAETVLRAEATIWNRSSSHILEDIRAFNRYCQGGEYIIDAGSCS